MAKWREDPCVKLPVPAWEIGSMHEKIDCRLREKEREERSFQSIEDRASSMRNWSWKSWRKKPKGDSKEAQRDEQRERETRSESKLESIERNVRDRRFSRSFEFSSIKLTTFRWLASLRRGV
ncbi:hypothetical protein EAG_08635 [Camponotus floridanus]|uniref:Uncharacterized protein n=1 Tax=Camponotus floridanus TaxID=104421 RepID=E2AVB9_CAMFO|nr:hypothetical protein EAG_08635 [Camponotus floridanus]